MTKDEIEKQKSLALAKLMGWNPSYSSDGRFISCMPPWCGGETLCPYTKTQQGLTQFAAIFLKDPEVMELFRCVNEMTGAFSIKPTQANILDEILRMYKLWQEEWSRCDE